MARMVIGEFPQITQQNLMSYRATEQAEGGKIVGVDPSVITACTLALELQTSQNHD